MRLALAQHSRHIVLMVNLLALLACTACDTGSDSTPTTAPTSNIPDITGVYAIGITASPACAQLPIDSFSFGTVAITQSTVFAGQSTQTQLNGDFSSGCASCSLSGTLSSTTWAGSLSVSGQVTGGGSLSPAGTNSAAVTGNVNASLPATPISSNLNGTITVISPGSGTPQTCSAADHHLTLTKQ